MSLILNLPPPPVQIVFRLDVKPDTVLGKNPYYDDLNTGPIHWSTKLYNHEKQIAIQHMLVNNGLLPEDKFWNYMRERWMSAIKGGHELRFEHWHPCVSQWLERDYKERLTPPVTPPIKPPIEPPIIPPIIPPVPEVVVPELNTALLLGAEIVLVWLVMHAYHAIHHA